jgi:integrase
VPRRPWHPRPPRTAGIPTGPTPFWALTPPPFLARAEPPAPAPRLSSVEVPERLHQTTRTLHYSRSTARSYAHWTARFLTHYTPRPPESLSGDDIRAFPTHLAVHGHVGPSTQNQALSALLFLFRRVLGRQIARVEGVVHARTPRRTPVVLSRAEVLAVLERMTGVPRLVCSLL